MYLVVFSCRKAEMCTFWYHVHLSQVTSHIFLLSCSPSKLCVLCSWQKPNMERSRSCSWYLDVVLAVILRLPGLRMSLSRMLTICSNLGRLFLSFCQQSNISWYSVAGQSMGGGRRYPSSTAFITCIQEGKDRTWDTRDDTAKGS